MNNRLRRLLRRKARRWIGFILIAVITAFLIHQCSVKRKEDHNNPQNPCYQAAVRQGCERGWDLTSWTNRGVYCWCEMENPDASGMFFLYARNVTPW